MPGLSQIPLGAPAGGMPNVLKPVGDSINNMFDQKRDSNNTREVLMANHALSSMRNERQHGYNMEMQGAKQSGAMALQRSQQGHQARQAFAQRMHETTLAQGSQKSAERLQNSRQRHEMRFSAQEHNQGLDKASQDQYFASQSSAQGHQQTLAELKAKGRMINNLGSKGRVADFKLGDMSAKFHDAPAPAAPTMSPPQAPSSQKPSGFLATPKGARQLPFATNKPAMPESGPKPTVARGANGKMVSLKTEPKAAPAKPSRAKKAAPGKPTVGRGPNGKMISLKGK